MPEDQDVLADEMATYAAEKAALLDKYPGRFVIIHGSTVIGTFESQVDALEHGVQTLGNVPFLVRQILAIEPTASYTSNLLAV